MGGGLEDGPGSPSNEQVLYRHRLDRHENSAMILLITVEDGVCITDITAPSSCDLLHCFYPVMSDEAVVGVGWHMAEPDRAVTKDV